MNSRPVVCQVHVDAGVDADAAELDALTRQLARELAKLPDVEVSRPPPEATNQNDGGVRAKGIGAQEIGTLLVKFGPAAALLLPLVEVVKAWVSRHAQRKVTIEYRGHKVELAGMSPREMDRRLAEFRSATSGIVISHE